MTDSPSSLVRLEEEVGSRYTSHVSGWDIYLGIGHDSRVRTGYIIHPNISICFQCSLESQSREGAKEPCGRAPRLQAGKGFQLSKNRELSTVPSGLQRQRLSTPLLSRLSMCVLYALDKDQEWTDRTAMGHAGDNCNRHREWTEAREATGPKSFLELVGKMSCSTQDMYGSWAYPPNSTIAGSVSSLSTWDVRPPPISSISTEIILFHSCNK